MHSAWCGPPGRAPASFRLGVSIARPVLSLFGLILGCAGVDLLLAGLVTDRTVNPPRRLETPYHRFDETVAPTREAQEMSIGNAFLFALRVLWKFQIS